MKPVHKRILVIFIVLVVLVVGGRYIDLERQAARSALSGFFESEPADLSSRIGGRIERYLVHEGDTVNVGEPLVILETAPSKAETQSKEDIAKQQEAMLREVMAGTRREDIQIQQQNVRDMTARLSLLVHGPRPEEIQEARAKLKGAQAVLQKLQAGPRPQEIAEALAAEQTARAHLAQVVRGLTQEEIAQYQARLESARAKERLAASNLKRMSGLLRQGAISQQQWDQSHTDQQSAIAQRQDAEEALKRAKKGSTVEEIDQAREQWKQARAALDLLQAGTRKEDLQAARMDVEADQQSLKLLLSGSRKEDIASAKAELAASQIKLNEMIIGNRVEEKQQAAAAALAAEKTALASRLNLRESVVKAPHSGLIERRLASAGDLVSAGAPLLRLSDPTDVWLRIFVPERILALVTVGCQAQLNVDGIPGTVQAYVESIATQGEFTPENLQTPDERGKQVFAVRIRLKHPDNRVKAGMYATVQKLGNWQ